uniref:NADH dehydrogenase [ubiquinone] 1 subunit C1, mitochondrial n=2 Tax=Canis lupus familiaris TaxID=9615 RepID=A0A8C0RBQ2_CANLF
MVTFSLCPHMPFSLCISIPGLPSSSLSLCLSCFPLKRTPWKVELTLGTTVFLGSYLINQHNDVVLEYKRRNKLE